jgi:hypothetical protein
VASADNDFHHDPLPVLIAPNLNPRSPAEPNVTELSLIELSLIELSLIERWLMKLGGTRPADLVFDPTFAC